MRKSPTAGAAMGALDPDKQCANLRGRAATDLRRLDRGTNSANRPECDVCSARARSWHGQWHGRGTPALLHWPGVLVSDRRPRQSSKRRRGTLHPRDHNRSNARIACVGEPSCAQPGFRIEQQSGSAATYRDRACSPGTLEWSTRYLRHFCRIGGSHPSTSRYLDN